MTVELYSVHDVNEVREIISCSGNDWLFIWLDTNERFFNGYAEVYVATISLWSREGGSRIYDCEISEIAWVYYCQSNEDAPYFSERLLMNERLRLV